MAGIFDAASVVLAPSTLALLFAAVGLGIVFGIIPGLTATLAVILLIPLTYGMEPTVGIAVLVALYIGGISGGLVSAILLGMPGTPSSIATTFDGYPMTRKGLAGKALKTGIFANLFGTMLSWLFLVTVAPEIAAIALKFRSVEYVAVIVFGLTTVISLSGDSYLKGLIACVFGLLLTTIGTDPSTGVERNTLGMTSVLLSGIDPTPAMIGMFVVAEVFNSLRPSQLDSLDATALEVKDQRLDFLEMWRNKWNFIRSSIIGVVIGIMPGLGGNLSSIVSYERAKKADKDPDSFGTGTVKGLIASETANNATIGGAMIPMLALGIPGDIVTAALIGGLMLHGLQPGPMLFVEHPIFVNGIYLSFAVSAIFMFGIMWVASDKLLPKLLLVPKRYLMPIVLIACTAGCYNISYNVNDLWTAVIFGLLGLLFSRFGIPVTPVIIAMILGRILEVQLRTALIDTSGSIVPFFTQPISCVFVLLAIGSVYYSLRKKVQLKTLLSLRGSIRNWRGR
ncbi:MAG: tripartite tricarboxylate transporter permease [Planctomycetes bacterium]|nr:tripartite tricarboxylate transporter permease [Planctomycetota bacterium]